MKSFLGGSVVASAALLAVSLGYYARPLAAETLLAQQAIQQQEQKPSEPQSASRQEPKEQAKAPVKADHAGTTKVEEPTSAPLTAPQLYEATAYSRKGRGASGMGVRAGTIAADPRILPFGTRVRLDAGQYTGEYIVTDSGSAIKGRKIDVWIPSLREACRFGRRNVKLTVLSYGGRRKR